MRTQLSWHVQNFVAVIVFQIYNPEQWHFYQISNFSWKIFHEIYTWLFMLV